MNKVLRKEWVDIVKGIGISLVVLGHTRFSNGVVGDWLNSFHMPLFFIIAGFCFDESRYPNYTSYFFRKMQALAFPYFSLSLFVIAIMSLLYFGTDKQFSTIQLLKNMISGGTIGAFWFICVLLQVELIFALIVRFFPSVRAQALMNLLCLCIAISLRGTRLPYFFDITLLSIPFYGLGYFTKYLEKLVCFNKILSLFFISILLISVHLSLIYIFSPCKTTYVGNQYSNPLLFTVLAIVGAFSVIFISRFIDCTIKTKLIFFKRAICFLGKNSIVLLATHNALGVCRASWSLGKIGVVVELLMLGLFMYLFSSPLNCFIKPNFKKDK